MNLLSTILLFCKASLVMLSFSTGNVDRKPLQFGEQLKVDGKEITILVSQQTFEKLLRGELSNLEL